MGVPQQQMPPSPLVAQPIFLVDQFGSPISSVGGPLPVSLTHGNVVSAANVNSSTALLAANGVFTGQWESSLPYSAISVEAFSDKASAANGLVIQQSQDGINPDITDPYSVVASQGFATIVNLVGAWFRVVYTNGASAQTIFRMQTIKQAAETVQPRSLAPGGGLPVQLSRFNVAVPANTAANTIIKGSPGFLCTVVVTTLGTVGITLFDNATTNAGTPLLVIPASAPVGTIYTLYGAANNGIVAAGVASCPGLTVYAA